MLGLLEDIVGVDYAPAAFWAVIVIVFLLLVLIILLAMRRRHAGVYVAGGRNRKQRLSIMDATAVDTHRRLVLVRRDDVEHLLLIGGNSDIVVERDIRLQSQSRRPAAPADVAHDDLPVTARPSAASRPAVQPGAPARPHVAPARAHSPQPLSAAAARPVQTPSPVNQAAKPKDQLDDDLMKELESALDIDEVVQPAKKPSLDDEMAKLLGELTNHKR